MSYRLSKSSVIRLHGRSTFINTPDDMKWLRDVHLPRLSSKFHSALLFGNEDSPDQIHVYEAEDPEVYDQPKIYVRSIK